jgi:hypothetical protein
MSEATSPEISAQTIATTLLQLPSDLFSSDQSIAQLKMRLEQLETELEVAEINASLAASVPDGKGSNADTRKLARDGAIAGDAQVQSIREQILQVKGKLEEEEAYNKMLARRFTAYCRISEMTMARQILMAKGETQL